MNRRETADLKCMQTHEVCDVSLPLAVRTQHDDAVNMVQGFAALLEQLALETLGLRFCELSVLPAAVAHHTSLRRLIIKDCDLKELPFGPYLERLRHLDLCDNRFTKVPPAVLAAPQLEVIAMLSAC